MSSPPAESPWSTLADDFDRVFEHLGGLAQAFAASVGDATDGYSRADVAALRPLILEGLEEFRDIAVGSGVVPVRGLLSDAEYWLEWWWRRSGREPVALRVNLDPAAPDFFDYTTDEWFTHPLETAERYLTGPYVDYACTNENTVTLAVPAYAAGRPLGVVAMDIPSLHIERRVMPTLSTCGRAAVLVSRDGRVIASSDPTCAPGSRVDLPARRREPRQTSAMHRIHSLTGWSLVQPSCGL